MIKTSKVTDFNQKCHAVFTSSLGNFVDIGTCISALMIQYGVQYKQPHQLDCEQESICIFKYNRDTEEYFLDEINNEAHNDFKRFDASCREFLDYSSAIWKEPRKVRTRVVKADTHAANALAVLKIFEPLNFKN